MSSNPLPKTGDLISSQTDGFQAWSERWMREDSINHPVLLLGHSTGWEIFAMGVFPGRKALLRNRERGSGQVPVLVSWWLVPKTGPTEKIMTQSNKPYSVIKCRHVCSFWNGSVFQIPLKMLWNWVEYLGKAQCNWNGTIEKIVLCFTFRSNWSCVLCWRGAFHLILWLRQEFFQ